jgi:ABC-type polysaccharide/polyol phosphate transport system ATPase subunit
MSTDVGNSAEAVSSTGFVDHPECLEINFSRRSSSSTKKYMTAISVSGLRKVYGKVTAVDDVNFDVERGEIFALLGPNGAS